MRRKKNITPHFTGKRKIITLAFIIIMLSFTNITLSSSNKFNSPYYNVSALSYQGSTEVKFTFNPTLSINISPSDLIIDNLTPGTTSDSNVINVSVATNASHGYTLSATVGNSLHNNTNLTHTNGTNTFNSITTDASLSNLTTDNTWGYSYKLSNNSNSNTWSNYSGLSSETSKTLVNTDDQTAKPIDFKIAAKASSTQASGAYTNTISFIAISKPIPKTIEDIVYMQTFGELVETDLQSVKNSMIKNTTYTLKDARDEQEYTIAKLEDGKIWMTKNLNLAGGTVITSELSDVPANYTLPTTNGFQEGNRLPESSQTGFSDNTMAYVYNTGNNTDNCVRPGCYSYYSWHAATAGSGVSITTANTDAPYSICPKGWKLPNTRTGTDETSDIRALMIALGGTGEITTYNTTTSPSGADMLNYLAKAPSNLLFAGVYDDSVLGAANSLGSYHTSTAAAGINNMYGLSINYFYATFAAGWGNRKGGSSVRCLAR